MKNVLLILISFFVFTINAQNDSLYFESFKKYFQIEMGFSYVNLNGKISEFTKQGGSLDISFADGKGKHLYGLNLNVMLTNKLKEFTIPTGYEHYDNPASALFGLFYGQIIGNQHKSHYQATIGLNYGWLYHKKLDDDIGGFHGLIPQLEISRSIRIGKSNFSTYQYTSQYTPMMYDPTISNNFLDIFVCYKQLLLNNAEGKGGLFSIGLRYKLNKYSIGENTTN